MRWVAAHVCPKRPGDKNRALTRARRPTRAPGAAAPGAPGRAEADLAPPLEADAGHARGLEKKKLEEGRGSRGRRRGSSSFAFFFSAHSILVFLLFSGSLS